MTVSVSELGETARVVVRVAGSLSRHCDRTEHNEQTSREVVVEAGAALRSAASALLRDRKQALQHAYAMRLAEMESRHPLAGTGAFDADEVVREAKTWRQLQQAQARHDAVYHPDVTGLAKYEQLKHYTLHLAKLAWIFQEPEASGTSPEDMPQRITDLLVFGVKLATVCGQVLPDEPVDIDR